MEDDKKANCEDKMSFDTAQEAQNAATVAGFQHGNALKVYQCKQCDLWHLSSNFNSEHEY